MRNKNLLLRESASSRNPIKQEPVSTISFITGCKIVDRQKDIIKKLTIFRVNKEYDKTRKDNSHHQGEETISSRWQFLIYQQHPSLLFFFNARGLRGGAEASGATCGSSERTSV
jgi:hypothetical protein